MGIASRVVAPSPVFLGGSCRDSLTFTSPLPLRIHAWIPGYLAKQVTSDLLLDKMGGASALSDAWSVLSSGWWRYRICTIRATCSDQAVAKERAGGWGKERFKGVFAFEFLIQFLINYETFLPDWTVSLFLAPQKIPPAAFRFVRSRQPQCTTPMVYCHYCLSIQTKQLYCQSRLISCVVR